MNSVPTQEANCTPKKRQLIPARPCSHSTIKIIVGSRQNHEMARAVIQATRQPCPGLITYLAESDPDEEPAGRM